MWRREWEWEEDEVDSKAFECRVSGGVCVLEGLEVEVVVVVVVVKKVKGRVFNE